LHARQITLTNGKEDVIANISFAATKYSLSQQHFDNELISVLQKLSNQNFPFIIHFFLIYLLI
jgi:hypothetical protein